MKLSKALLLASVLVTGGCISPLIKDSTTLDADEGIIAMSMRCGEGLNWGLFFASGAASKGMLGGLNNSAGVECNDGVWTRVVKSGRYFLGQVGSQAALDIEEQRAPSFIVEPQRITYIGEILVPSVRPGGGNTTFVGHISILDRSTETHEVLKTRLPEITKRYPFVTALASVPVSDDTASAP